MRNITISLEEPLTQTYMAHAALLAVKLLALSPIAAFTWVNKGLFPNTDIIRRAYLSELKNLAPFWIVGALYVTTGPSVPLGKTLIRAYTISRVCVVLGYATKPIPALISDLALITSYFINSYMSVCVIYKYKDCLYRFVSFNTFKLVSGSVRCQNVGVHWIVHSSIASLNNI
ncbi:unnamed protein product [Pieris macdunnoughi]|uniref:Microsomal glutathione S-transferase 1 n=1 Tax=Pieris macdunnoughi TaxID=345717 RepID=A0A821S4C4_9NEOP|nr:unnamed protein product [Pieris macdunnoughi]